MTADSSGWVDVPDSHAAPAASDWKDVEDSPVIESAPKPDPSILHQMAVGFKERGIGLDETLNQIGLGQYVPMYVDGKIKLGLPSNEDFAEEEKRLEKQETGGLSGWLARQGGDPISYLPTPGKLGIGLKGAIQSGVSSLLGATDNPKETLAGRAGKAAVAAPLGFATGKTFGYAGGKLAEKLNLGNDVASVAKAVTPTTDAKSTLGWIKNFVTDTKSPPTITKDVESLNNAAKKVGLSIVGKEPKQVYQEIKDWYTKNVSDIALNQSKGIVAGETHPVGVNFAISETYDKSRQEVSKLYQAADKLGAGQMVETEGLKQELGSLIGEMKAKAPTRGIDPKHDATLDKLEELYDEIGSSHKPTLNQMLGHTVKEPETVSGTWLSDLKQTLNQYHVPSPSRTRKDIPYVRLGASVREAIGKTSPEFQDALAKADAAHTEVERVFSNKTLSKFWTPEDHDAFKLVTGRGGNLNADTAARADKILDNIKTSSDLDALREALPKEYYDSVRSAKFFQLMNKAGLNADDIDKNYDMIVKSLRNDPTAVHTVDAIKTMVEEMNARNIKNISPAAFQKSENLKDRAIRYIADHYNSRAKVINSILGTTAKKQTSTQSQERVAALAKDLTKTKPKQIYTPGVIPRALGVPVENSIGKITAQ